MRYDFPIWLDCCLFSSFSFIIVCVLCVCVDGFGQRTEIVIWFSFWLFYPGTFLPVRDYFDDILCLYDAHHGLRYGSTNYTSTKKNTQQFPDKNENECGFSSFEAHCIIHNVTMVVFLSATFTSSNYPFQRLVFCYFLSLLSFVNFMVWFNLSSGLFAMLLEILYKLNGNCIAFLYNFYFNFMKQLSRKNLHEKFQQTFKLMWLIVLFSIINVYAKSWNICA